MQSRFSQRDVLLQTIRRAIVMEKSFDLKSSVVDLVTETDKAVETFIINSLKERYPDHQ